MPVNLHSGLFNSQCASGKRLAVKCTKAAVVLADLLVPSRERQEPGSEAPPR